MLENGAWLIVLQCEEMKRRGGVKGQWEGGKWKGIKSHRNNVVCAVMCGIYNDKIIFDLEIDLLP